MKFDFAYVRRIRIRSILPAQFLYEDGEIMTVSKEIPFTRNGISTEKEQRIRSAVRGAESLPTDNAMSRIAVKEDAELFHEFLSDPQISAPIYTLPRPLTVDALEHFIAKHAEEQSKGEGLLFLNFNSEGEIGGYQDICIWPRWAAGELGGAVHPDRQGKRKGIEGAKLGFDWMFNILGLDLICETASLNNHRTARLLDGLGFKRMGETLSQRDDGTTRASLVWEISKEQWCRKHGD
ncbi:GNAT family N-acetyltransferase [Sphingorhabdus sp. EL138]|uniref:GNAT family N-acetyltransferase n=1 Tax=Sphingorhabdus sp. EL138 TaxID=2073156 RepID=UPI0013A56B55|nr:GNAT family N-acetyltransferase [Sphingorhabdus sp. EL138]